MIPPEFRTEVQRNAYEEGRRDALRSTATLADIQKRLGEAWPNNNTKLLNEVYLAVHALIAYLRAGDA